MQNLEREGNRFNVSYCFHQCTIYDVEQPSFQYENDVVGAAMVPQKLKLNCEFAGKRDLADTSFLTLHMGLRKRRNLYRLHLRSHAADAAVRTGREVRKRTKTVFQPTKPYGK